MATIKNHVLKRQNETDRTFYTTWKWDKDKTDHYAVAWQYDTGNGVWFVGSSDDTKDKQSIYSAPTNAKKIRVRIKPVSKTYKDKNNKDKAYWTADWCAWKVFEFPEVAIYKAGAPYNININPEAGADKSLIATWDFKESNVDSYQVVWQYHTGKNVWLDASDSNTTSKQSKYTYPDNASKVRFRVKAISKTHTVYGKESTYWNGDWSAWEIYDIQPVDEPEVPAIPTVEMDKLQMKIEVETNDKNTERIQFQIIYDDKHEFKTMIAKPTYGVAKVTLTVSPGREYKVRARGAKTFGGSDPKTNIQGYSAWSDYSDNVATIPQKPNLTNNLKASSATSVTFSWDECIGAESYEVEYAEKYEYFDKSAETKTMTTNVNSVIVTGLETGKKWYFRCRSKNTQGESDWSNIVNITIGKAPEPPTTWSNVTTVVRNEDVVLYWIHNSSDGSSQVEANIRFYVNGVQEPIVKVPNNRPDSEKDKTSSYIFPTNDCPDRTKIEWQVKTKGITEVYSNWSTKRSFMIYEVPKIIHMSDSCPSEMTSYPYRISFTLDDNTKYINSYEITIRSKESYECLNNDGTHKIIKAGDIVYQVYRSGIGIPVEYILENIDCTDFTFQNGVTYEISTKVTMDTGLSDESIKETFVNIDALSYVPDVVMDYRHDDYTLSIKPECRDENDRLVADLYLSIYRKTYDGKFIPIMENILNEDGYFVTDPHPSLKNAMYRITTQSKITGIRGFYDTVPLPINEPYIIIQWDEEVRTLSEEAGNPILGGWSGSILKLMYNIDIQESVEKDRTSVQYIGREDSVVYYGTYVGKRQTWSCCIPANDKDTEEILYTLRRLQKWMGNVYARNHLGEGFWATVDVEFNTNHDDVTIPITLNLEKVDGGA